MEIDVVKASKIVGGLAAFIVASGVIYTTSLSAFDDAHKEFVTVGQLAEVFDNQDLKKVKKRIRRLEWQQNNGGLNPEEQWELSDLYDEQEDLQ
jgi:ATP-dependent DNA ligase